MEIPEFSPSSCTSETVKFSSLALITFVPSNIFLPSVCFGGFVTVTSKDCMIFTGTVISNASSRSGTCTSTTPVFSPILLVSGLIFHEYFVPSGMLLAFFIPFLAKALSFVKSASLEISTGAFTATGASFT